MARTPVVAIDARWITPTPSGIGVFTRELVRRLPALEPTWKWHLVFKDPAIRDDVLADCGFASSSKVQAHLMRHGPFSPRGHAETAALLRGIRCDLFHSTNFMLPYFAFGGVGTALGMDSPGNRGCGVCVTNIHDAIPLILRDYAPRSRTSRMLWFYRLCLKAAIRCSAATITGSESSRRDLVKVLGLSKKASEKITTVYDGVSDRFSPAPSDAVFEYAPKDPAAKLILYVGRLDPYKNVPALVDAFAQLRRKTGRPLHLLVVGPEDDRYPEARQHARYRDVAEHVTFLHDASDADLLAAYRSASLLVNPSRYEGFGLPMLEAMKCGTPVVCADGGSQREISGGAAEVVPVGNEPALVAAMEKVLFDDALRAEMVARGRERAAFFTWEKTAEQTLGIYRSVLG